MAGNSNGTLGFDFRSLSSPVSIFVDNNNTLVICDRDNNRIVKYYANSATRIVVAGNLTVGNSPTQLNSPKGVAVDQYDSIVVADSANYRIQKFSAGSIVGITQAVNSSVNLLGHTRDLHIDVNNNVYVTDSVFSQVIKFYPNNGIGVVLVGSAEVGAAANQLRTPYGNFIDVNETLYIADYGNQRVQMWPRGATNGVTVAGVTGVAEANNTLLSNPISIVVDNNG